MFVLSVILLILLEAFIAEQIYFFFKDNDRIIVSSSYKNMLMLTRQSNRDINKAYVQCFILGAEYSKEETIYTGITNVFPGDVIHVNFLTKEQHKLGCCNYSKYDNPLDEIEHNVSLFSADKPTYLFLSGGFDSTLVFHALKRKKIPFTAVNYLPLESESDSENDDVIHLCKTYGVDIIFIKRSITLTGCEKVTELAPNYPEDVPFIQNIYANPESEAFIQDRKNMFFYGHGGDHLFVQNPSALSAVDAFYDNGIGSMLSVIRKYCLLKGRNFNSIFSQTLWFLLRSRTENVVCPTWLSASIVKEHRPMNKKQVAKEIYQKSIDGAIRVCQQADQHGQVNCLSPFLFNNVIACFSEENVYDMFTAEYDRSVIRQLAFERYKNPALWKKRKRSSLQLAFNVFRENRKRYLETIDKSGVCDVVALDMAKLKEDLDYNATVKLSSTMHCLINLYQISLFLLFLQKNE